MRLGEVTMDSHVDVEVIKGDTSVHLQTSPIGVSEDALYVEPFMHNGSRIAFNAPDLSIEMVVAKIGEVPNFWSNVTIDKGEYEGNRCHVIRSRTTGVRLNRRNSFRVFVGLSGSATREMTGDRFPVVVKDVSASGIGIMPIRSGESFGFEMGEAVHIYCQDPECRYSIDVDGKIVRVEEINDGDVVYGCKFMRYYPQLNKYVTQKQLKNKNKNFVLSI